MERSLDFARDDTNVEPIRQKGGIYVKEGNAEVDAADHSVGDHGSTHGTGSNLVHGHVERRGRRLGSSAPFLIVISTTLEMTNGSARDDKGTQEEKETREPYPMRPPPILVTRLNGSN